MENQTIINGIYALIMASLIGFTYIGATDDLGVPLQEPTHKCEDRMIAYHCESLSKYYSLPNGKCISTEGNKLCRSGWEEIQFEVKSTTQSSGRVSCIYGRCGV